MVGAELSDGLSKGGGSRFQGSEVLDRFLSREMFREDFFEVEQEHIRPELRRKFLSARSDTTHLAQLLKDFVERIVIGEDRCVAAEKGRIRGRVGTQERGLHGLPLCRDRAKPTALGGDFSQVLGSLLSLAGPC